MSLYKQLIALSLTTVCFNVAAQEEVYRWVDEQGNVHYADQPRSANAKRFNPRQFNNADPVASAEEVEANNIALSSVSKDEAVEEEVNAQENLEAETTEIPSETCRYLKGQMNKAKEELNSNNPSRVRQARIYLDTADKMLKQSECD